LYFASAGINSAAFTRAVNNLLKYEHIERILLLELVSWKAACIRDMDENKTILDVLEWMNDGWKENKTRLRYSTATTVIVENVLGFLGGPRKVTDD
jgi:hypothetical protein